MKNNNTLQRMQTETQSREITIDLRATDEDARTVELAFSSEIEVERWFGGEILDHATGAMRMGRLNDKAALLMDHNSRDQIGVIESARIDGDKVGRAVVRFSKSERGQEMFQDVLDGIRSKVSVGYRIHEATLEKTGDAGDVYRITDWEPFEISLVAIPADDSVGVGRSAETPTNSAQVEKKAGAMPENLIRKEVVMNDTVKTDAAPEVNLEAARKETLTAERTRVGEIEASADRAKGMCPGAVELAREAIASGSDIGAFREALLVKMNENSKAQRSPLGLTDKDVANFSMVRLLRAAATGDWADAGHEREVCTATAKRAGGTHKGIMVPTDVLSRAVTTTVSAPTIQTDILSMSFIDLLRAKMKVRGLGATVLGGLEGNISIPRQSAGAGAFWVAEGGQPTANDQAFDAVDLSPKGVAALTQTTMQNLMQSSLDMEAFIRRDLATALALAIDLAAISGTGAGNQPLGILNTAGIGSIAMGANGAALTNIDQLIALETLVADTDADGDSMAYLTNARVAGALKTLKTTTGEYLFKGSVGYTPEAIGSVNGYDLVRSNQVGKTFAKGTGTGLSGMLFGNWSDLLVGEWGALNLQVDPYSAGVGNIKISALQFVDCGVRHPESFAAITDIIA